MEERRGAVHAPLSVAEATAYVGLIPLALALAALPLGRRSPHARFWLILGALALVMALGPRTPLHRLLFLLPGYNREGKSYLTIAIGCTGGKHRSVAAAEALARRLAERGCPARVTHRDIEKE